MNKTKKSGFAIVAIVLIIVFALGFVLIERFSKGSKNNPNLNIGGITTPSGQDNSEEYLALINQYSKQVTELQSQISSIKADRDKQLAEKNAEIKSLQEDINNMQTEDADIISAKNARINALKEAIKTLEEETNEAVTSYEARIASLNASLSEYESEVIRTISLPTNFKFTELGFKIVDDNNFVFYSKSHSCNLYYYNYQTKKMTMLPIKGSSFDNFYKTSTFLYFRSSDNLYVYDFEKSDLKLLSVCKFAINYVSNDTCVYIFDIYGNYAIHNFVTGVLIGGNFPLSVSSSYSGSFQTSMIDNYILYTSYGVTPTTSSTHLNLQLFNTITLQKYYLSDNVPYLYSFTKYNDKYYFIGNTGFYSLNLADNTAELIQSFSTNNGRVYILDDNLLMQTTAGIYCYDGIECKLLSSTIKTMNDAKFLKVDTDVYYMFSTVSVKGMYKIDFSSKTLTQLSANGEGFFAIENIDHYAFVFGKTNCFVIDLDNGSFEELGLLGTSLTKVKIKKFETEKHILFVPEITKDASTSASIIAYDKENESYGYVGKSKNAFNYFRSAELKNGKLYVLTNSALQCFNLGESLDNSILNISVNGSMSNLEKGIFYSSIGEVTDGQLYVRSYLQSDGTFKKEFVVVKK